MSSAFPDYTPFNGICLTDTFQLGETDDANLLFTPRLLQNSERVIAQQKAPIRVIIGNPPYSVGQRSANDNAQNQSYPKLENRIAKTYAAGTAATNKNSLYDSYIKAFRWASDRLPKEDGGIIAFVSNAGWIDGNAMDGMRKCLEEEFSGIYVYNLRGNQRTSGETSRREGGKIFGSGSRTPIAITLLVKKPNHKGKAVIHYKDIGDYLSREEKLEIIAKSHNALHGKMDWRIIQPNEHADWLNQRNDLFGSFIPLGDKDNKDNKQTVFVPYYSNGLKTNADSWMYNSKKEILVQNMTIFSDTYNNEVKRFCQSDKTIPFEYFAEMSPQKIKWHSGIIPKATNGIHGFFDSNKIVTGLYRPYEKQYTYFDTMFVQRVAQLPKLFPTPKQKNLVICLPANKNELPLISNSIPDLHLNGDSQCFPLYWYEAVQEKRQTLFDRAAETPEGYYARHDGITDFILDRCRENYGHKVTKEDIFYYVYGLLHSPDYRTQFAADLKKMLPRLPLAERPLDFWAFSKAGRKLADLHLNYEEQPPCPAVTVTGAESEKFHVEKMRFGKFVGANNHSPNKEDKSVIEYNPWISLSGVPMEAYEYVVNGRSAIEWIMERYQVKIDKDSGIKNDPNDWASEHNKPRYILDLLQSIITVSLETRKIVNNLPNVTF
jgi:predicted helicase